MPRRKIPSPPDALSADALPALCARIRVFREKRGLAQKDLARAVGVTANAVCNWENGRSRPDVNLIPALCIALRIPIGELFGIQDQASRIPARQQELIRRFDRLNDAHRQAVTQLMDALFRAEEDAPCPDLTVLPCFHRALAAGTGDPSDFEDCGEPVYVYTSPEVRRADCIFTVNGNSMEPDFRNGQDVLVQRVPGGPDLRFGEIGAFIVGNEAYIKEYREDGLHSLNRAYGVMRFGEYDSVSLIGRVLGVFDKSQYATPEDIRKYRISHGDG